MPEFRENKSNRGVVLAAFLQPLYLSLARLQCWLVWDEHKDKRDFSTKFPAAASYDRGLPATRSDKWLAWLNGKRFLAVDADTGDTISRTARGLGAGGGERRLTKAGRRGWSGL